MSCLHRSNISATAIRPKHGRRSGRVRRQPLACTVTHSRPCCAAALPEVEGQPATTSPHCVHKLRHTLLQYGDEMQRFINLWREGQSGVTYTPKGLAWTASTGSLRNTANAAFLALLYGKLIDHGRSYYDARVASCWAHSQLRYLLGSGTGQSFVVGLEPKYPGGYLLPPPPPPPPPAPPAHMGSAGNAKVSFLTGANSIVMHLSCKQEVMLCIPVPDCGTRLTWLVAAQTKRRGPPIRTTCTCQGQDVSGRIAWHRRCCALLPRPNSRAELRDQRVMQVSGLSNRHLLQALRSTAVHHVPPA